MKAEFFKCAAQDHPRCLRAVPTPSIFRAENANREARAAVRPINRQQPGDADAAVLRHNDPVQRRTTELLIPLLDLWHSQRGAIRRIAADHPAKFRIAPGGEPVLFVMLNRAAQLNPDSAERREVLWLRNIHCSTLI